MFVEVLITPLDTTELICILLVPEQRIMRTVSKFSNKNKGLHFSHITVFFLFLMP